MSWTDDKRWSDKFMPEIKQILGMYLIGEPPVEEDCERNTDLIVLKMEAVRIACRIRRNEYFQRYPEEITIRMKRPNGSKTELTKIIEGWGDYFFYGFADENESHLCAWKLCKLNIFRLWFNQQLFINKGLIPGILKPNSDNSSSFLAIKADNIKNFILAQQ